MSTQPIVPPNPGLLQPRAASVIVNRVLVNQNRRLRTAKREIYQVPGMKQRFEDAGGLETVLASDAETPESIAAVESVATIQSAAILDQMSAGDIDNVPALETMLATSQDNNKRIISIASHLDDCCEDIKDFLRNLRKQIQNNFENTIKSIESSKNAIILEFQSYSEKLLELYKKEKLEFSKKYSSEKSEILNEIRILIQEELVPIHTDIKILNTKVENLMSEVKEDITNIQNDIHYIKHKTNTINETINNIKTTTNTINETTISIKSTTHDIKHNLNSFISDFNTYLISWDDWKKFFNHYKNKILPAELVGVVAIINKLINGKFKNITKEADDKFTELKQYIDKEFKELPETTAIETSLHVVGEAYKRWDSITTYFACVVFVFNELNPTENRRRSQIKLRLNVLNKDVSPEVIAQLELKIAKLQGFNYLYGPTRGFYVSATQLKKRVTNPIGANISNAYYLPTM